ncbi:3-hydroxybutyryl-CoA dehydrogenase [Actinomadura sp. NBRC 104425]|uniref:3-hydroxyacyl-CoA dehydrogenase n=1 Tax=Actinomadura sp. NBRC 104425 TaxID=3032204 RepID=UPI0024A18450|nr:3-hydroxyacyl-CoA dehydrogenase [Actinomadura sp. NBRC 104425]GLZ13150.1 3-hydroxybutyryl-CoA dehydrogenase [Actinomadura sp. NBRC 104425]
MTGGSFGKVGVVGLGTMGAGIAEVLARGGLAVVGIEVGPEALERGRGNLESSTGRAVKRGRLTEEARREILGRVALSTEFADLGDCDLVIEAVPERLDLKRRVFAELDRVCRDDAVLATNTSSLSVTEIAAATARPAQVVGVHFFNPAPVMKLVEVIRTVLTDPEAVRRVAELVTGLGKTPVTVGDRAGFVANRLLFGYLNQAAAMLENGHATRDDIDTAMTVGAGLPMGPFTLMDLIGLDTCLEVLEAVHAESRDRRHAPSPLLRELVTAGLLGRKTGRGFYDHGAAAPAPSGEPSEAAPPAVGVAGTDPSALAVAAACARAGGRVRATADAESGLRALLDDAGALARIETGDPASFADCDLIVADASAPPAVLGEAAGPDAVLAIASDTGPVIEHAAATGRPGAAVGLHLPEPGGTLVEIATTVLTDPGTADRAAALVAALGLTAVRCRDRAGFIVDALRFPYLNDAAAMLEAGYADADSIDAAMTLGCGYPAGPVADLDRLGLDRAVTVLRALYAETREAALAPSPLLEEHVRAGRRTLR